MSLWGWDKYFNFLPTTSGTLIYRTTRGREKIDLVRLRRPCPVWSSRSWPEISELRIAGRKRSFSAKCACSLVLRHVPGSNDLRSKTMAEKNTDGEDFRGANQLRVDNGRNRSVKVKPCLHLITRITMTMMAKQA